MQPITTGISASADTFSLYSSGIYDDDACAAGNIDHSVLIVGYGTDADTGFEYFILKNSWGTNWGEDGFMRLKILTADDSSLLETKMSKGGYCKARGDHSYPGSLSDPEKAEKRQYESSKMMKTIMQAAIVTSAAAKFILQKPGKVV